MLHSGFGGRRDNAFDVPIEMRFVDLFMIIVAALMFVAVMLSVISAFVGGVRVDLVPKITTTAVPDALVQKPYSLTLAASGGAAPYTWELASGSLPAGLTLEQSGVLVGTPIQRERTQFSVRVTDNGRRSDERQLAVSVEVSGSAVEEVVQKLRMSSGVIMLPDGVVGTPYQFRLVIDGGAPPYQWRVTRGQLPKGLDLTASGEVVGVPNARTDAQSFDITATDVNRKSTIQEARLEVANAPTPLWQRVLYEVVNWGPWVIGLLVGVLIVYTVLKGIPAGYQQGMPGLLDRMRRRRGR